jgi:hypothetical protein
MMPCSATIVSIATYISYCAYILLRGVQYVYRCARGSVLVLTLDSVFELCRQLNAVQLEVLDSTVQTTSEQALKTFQYVRGYSVKQDVSPLMCDTMKDPEFQLLS